jgi:hypothetical protein
VVGILTLRLTSLSSTSRQLGVVSSVDVLFVSPLSPSVKGVLDGGSSLLAACKSGVDAGAVAVAGNAVFPRSSGWYICSKSRVS